MHEIPTRWRFSTNSSATPIASSENYPAAIQTYQEMAKLGPESEKRAQLLLIETYRDSRDIDRAIAETKKALAESPKDPNSDRHARDALRRKGRPGAGDASFCKACCRATTTIRKFISISRRCRSAARNMPTPNNPRKRPSRWRTTPADKETAWFMLGAIYERRKNSIRPSSSFARCSTQNPNNASALNYYGYMLADRGIRLDEATSLIQRAVKQEPEQRRLSRQPGLGLLQAKQTRRSRRISAQSCGPRRPRSHDSQPSRRCVSEAGTE